MSLTTSFVHGDIFNYADIFKDMVKSLTHKHMQPVLNMHVISMNPAARHLSLFAVRLS